MLAVQHHELFPATLRHDADRAFPASRTLEITTDFHIIKRAGRLHATRTGPYMLKSHGFFFLHYTGSPRSAGHGGCGDGRILHPTIRRRDNFLPKQKATMTDDCFLVPIFGPHPPSRMLSRGPIFLVFSRVLRYFAMTQCINHIFITLQKPRDRSKPLRQS